MIQPGDEVMYYRGGKVREPVWCDVKAVYGDGSVYVLLPSYDACVLAEHKIAGWIRSPVNHSNFTRLLRNSILSEMQP